MFSIFKSDPCKKLKKQHLAILEKAMLAQRNGDIKSYSQLTVEADTIYKQLQALEQSGSAS
jgi:Family of unknown function (DUF6435)